VSLLQPPLFRLVVRAKNLGLEYLQRAATFVTPLAWRGYLLALADGLIPQLGQQQHES